MRGAFVVQLEPETKPSESRFEGLVEEVDSGTELRFRSAAELMEERARFRLSIPKIPSGANAFEISEIQEE
jgi:hypothetical protein